MQDTPATVWVPRAQTLSTGPILLTRLDGNLCNLKAHAKVRVTVKQCKHETHKIKALRICVLCALKKYSLNPNHQQMIYHIFTTLSKANPFIY